MHHQGLERGCRGPGRSTGCPCPMPPKAAGSSGSPPNCKPRRGNNLPIGRSHQPHLQKPRPPSAVVGPAVPVLLFRGVLHNANQKACRSHCCSMQGAVGDLVAAGAADLHCLLIGTGARHRTAVQSAAQPAVPAAVKVCVLQERTWQYCLSCCAPQISAAGWLAKACQQSFTSALAHTKCCRCRM